MTSVPTLWPESPARATISSSASAPALKQRVPSAPPLRARQSSEADEFRDGTRSDEYYALVSSLSERSLGYLELLSGTSFSYQHMEKRESSRMLKQAGLELDEPSKEDMAKYIRMQERPFKSLYDHRKVQHVFPITQRWAIVETPPDAQLLGPGDHAPGLRSRFDGPMAPLRSRLERAPGEELQSRNVGPGRYTPGLSGLRLPLGEYDQTIPSALSRVERVTGPQPGDTVQGDYEPNNAKFSGARAPGHRSIRWAEPDLLKGSDRLGAIGASTSTGPGVGPGAYKPKLPAEPHRYSAKIIARPVDSKLVEEALPGPNTYHMPDRPPDTTPAGQPFRAITFADRPFLEPSRSADEKAAVAARQEMGHQKTLAALTPEGSKRQKAEAALRIKLHNAKLQEAKQRRAAVLAAQEEKARVLKAAIDARPTAEERKAQILAKMENCRRQSVWMMLLKAVNVHQQMAAKFEASRDHETMEKASAVIAKIWKKSPVYTTKKNAKEVLSKELIYKGLRVFIARSRLKAAHTAANILRDFLTHSQEAGPFVAAMRGLTLRIRRIQMMWRKFLSTREARLQIAMKQWDLFEDRKAFGDRKSSTLAPASLKEDTSFDSNLATQREESAPAPASRRPSNEKATSFNSKPEKRKSSASSAPATKPDKRSNDPHEHSSFGAPAVADVAKPQLKRSATGSHLGGAGTGVPLALKRAKLTEWLKRQTLEHRKRCFEYYDRLLPRIQADVERQMAANYMQSAKDLLRGASDAATVADSVLHKQISTERRMAALVHGLAGPPPYFKQRLPEVELAKMIQAAKEEARLNPQWGESAQHVHAPEPQLRRSSSVKSLHN